MASRSISIAQLRSSRGSLPWECRNAASRGVRPGVVAGRRHGDAVAPGIDAGTFRPVGDFPVLYIPTTTVLRSGIMTAIIFEAGTHDLSDSLTVDVITLDLGGR